MKEGKTKRNQPYCIRTFRCPECGNHAYASKIGAVTGNGHKKKMYCPWCMEDRRNMEDKKYIVSGEYLRQIREEVRDVAHMIQEQPLLPVIKNKMRKRLLKAEDMLFPDSPDSPNANLREHVCRCNHGRQDG